MLSVFICWLHKTATEVFVWCVHSGACCSFHMVMSVCCLFVESSVGCPIFGLGFFDIPAHPSSCSGWWHWSFDCWFRHGAVLCSAFVLLCVHDFVVYFCWCCKEYLSHNFVVCHWIMLCSVISIVGFSHSPMKKELVLLFSMAYPVEAHIHHFDDFGNDFICDDATCSQIISLY